MKFRKILFFYALLEKFGVTEHTMKKLHNSFKECKQYNDNWIISQLQVRMCI